MTKIEKIYLRYFRGIIKGEVELAPLTILVGPNNTGKTSILEAILLAHGVTNPLVTNLTPLDVLSSLHETLSSKGLDHLIYGYGSKHKRAIIRYTINSKTHDLIINVKPLEIEIRLIANSKQTIEDLMLRKTLEGEALMVSFTRFTAEKLSSSRHSFLKVMFIKDEIIKNIYKYMYNKWIEIVGKKLTKKTANWISNLINLDASDITIEPFGGGVYALLLYLKDGSRIRLGDLGDGVQMLIASRIVVGDTNPDIILWDDVESHMNPRALTMLADWLSELVKGGKQVILTTHSLEATKIIAKTVPNSTIIKLNLENGILLTKKYSVDEISELEEMGLDVRV